MQQIEDLNIRRNLGDDEDVELMADQDLEQEERELKTKIIFNIQGLGGVRSIKRNDRLLQAYIKGPHCEECVKDLVKFIKQDAPSNPKARIILADYNIAESDLLELLVLQVEDKKLSFWIIALLQLLTQKPSDDLSPEEKAKINQNLCQYKNSFVKHQCFQILMVHIADFYKTTQEERLRAHYQMMEFIIKLIRNLVQIPNNEEHPSLHNHFLAGFIKEDMFNPLLYIVQTDRSQLMQRIDICLLQIFYHTFTCFDPALLYSSKQSTIGKSLIKSKINFRAGPTRHSRFLPLFQITTETGIQKVVHDINNQTQKDLDKQRKKPIRKSQYKKVFNIQSDKLGQNFMKIQIDNEGGDIKNIGDSIIQVTRQFLEVEFQQLVKLIFDDVFRENAKVTQTNTIQYLLLCSWALQVVRQKYKKERALAANDIEKDRVEFSFGWIVQVMQTPHFQLIYRVLFRQANREKRKQFRINTFHAGFKLFNSYLDVISDISLSMNMSDRKNANVLMANVFRHDIAKIFRTGFNYIFHEGVLKSIIKATHKFFKLLSIYSQGKTLTIQTTKLLKKPRKKNKEDYYNQQQQLLRQDDSDSQKQKQQGKRTVAQEQRYQQRKYNEKSEFAIIAEYGVISKYLLFWNNDRFLLNNQELNESIFYYFFQIKKLLSGQWLFFQAETMCTFQRMISNKQWGKNNKTKVKFLSDVCKSFIILVRKNPLALTECLFRFSNLSLKDHVLRNYSEDYDQIGQQEQNMFTDQ